MIEVQTRFCTGCERELPLSAFRKCTRCKGGIQSRCGECQAKIQAASYRKRLAERGDEMRAMWRDGHARRAAAPKADPGEMRFCTGCQAERPVGEFSANPNSPDGLRSRCRICTSEVNRARYDQRKADDPDGLRAEWREDRARRPEAALAATRASYERNREHYAERSAEYRLENPEIKAAHRAVESAVSRGILPVRSELRCAIDGCNSQCDEYHHWSYEPENHLSVIPLCTSHHRLIHSGTLIVDDPQSLAISPT